jgi:butyrate kinase
MKKILAINLGSTSTKIAYYEDEECKNSDTVYHSSESLRQHKTILDQTDMRKEIVLSYMKDHEICLDDLDAFVSRGSLSEPIESGVYEVNYAMVEQVESGDYGLHASAVGVRIAYDLVQGRKALALTADTPSTDELGPLARYSGLKEIVRYPLIHTLNNKAMAKHYAESVGKDYRKLNLIVANLGGGISVVVHKGGRMVEAPDAVAGEGAFSTNRSGYLSVGPLIRLCYSGRYTQEEMLRHVNGEAGLLSYLGTVDVREIEKLISEGDTYAAEVLDALCYQVAKEIGACAAVLEGSVDAILIIGGMAHSSYVTERIAQRVRFIAPVEVMPGEREMEALCLSAYEALLGKETIKEFIPRKDERRGDV